MPIFDREEEIRKKKGVFESPIAENIHLAILQQNKKGPKI